MTKYFTIAIAGATQAEEQAIAAHWKGLGWWHGVANFWLLRDHNDTMSAASVRDDLGKLAPQAKVMVVEVAPTTWASSSLTVSNRDWLKNHWPPEGM